VWSKPQTQTLIPKPLTRNPEIQVGIPEERMGAIICKAPGVLQLSVDANLRYLNPKIQTLNPKPQTPNLKPQTPNSHHQGAGCRVQGAGCRVQGAGCRVEGLRVQALQGARLRG
jgi:hypothetical protein